MPSSSKQQQKFMGMAHALKKGEMKPSDASPELKRVAKSMSDKDVKDFASTSHKGLPKKVKQEIARKLREYANKMGRDHLGGDDYTKTKKGGLRDFDGYDNVDYNKDMPMDEVSSTEAYKISRMLGTGQQSTQDFIEDNKIDVKKLESYIKKLSPPKKIIIKDIINGSTDTRLSNIKKGLVKQVKESLDEACWKGYKQVGGKMKNGKQVPNCVPTNKSISESMMSTLDQMKKDSKNIRDFIKKVLSDKDFRDMKGDKDFIKYLGSMYEGVTEGGIPQNWMQGRTSDYHTKLRGKKREYDDTNFEKDNSGQEDLEEYGQRLDLSYLEDEEARLDGTPPPKDAIDRDLEEQTINELGIFPIRAFLQDMIPGNLLKTITPEDKERLKSTIKNLIITLNKFWKQNNIPFRVKEGVSTPAKRDYKAEYKKFQSSTKSKKYRAELNKYNRDKGTYGNGDGKDASHKGGKISGFETESKNRGRREKSRLKKK